MPQEWMQQATTRYVQSSGATAPYGLTFWVVDEWENVPTDTFASRGHNVNDCYVIPSLDLVVARQGNDNPTGPAREHFAKTLIQMIVAAVL